MYFLWNCLISSIAIHIVAQGMPGVRTDGFGRSFTVSVLYSVLFGIGYWLMVKIGAFPALVALITMGLAGPLVVGTSFAVVSSLICFGSLFVADQLVEGFEIDSFGTTVVTAFLVGVCSIPLHAVLGAKP